jgi:heme/copper-type cytochrome/quinol oxidase subunit 2
MKGVFKVVTPEDYEKYMAEKSKAGGGNVSFE